MCVFSDIQRSNDFHCHYENTPMQYVHFHCCKNDNFQMKNCAIFLLIFAQNIDSGYTLEPPH